LAPAVSAMPRSSKRIDLTCSSGIVRLAILRTARPDWISIASTFSSSFSETVRISSARAAGSAIKNAAAARRRRRLCIRLPSVFAKRTNEPVIPHVETRSTLTRQRVSPEAQGPRANAWPLSFRRAPPWEVRFLVTGPVELGLGAVAHAGDLGRRARHRHLRDVD